VTHKKPNPLPALDFDKCILLMKAILGERPRVEREFSIGITTTSGRRAVIDSKADPVVEERGGDVALAIVTSEQTLARLLTGTLDSKSADRLFVWGGDLGQWSRLIDAVSAYNSVSVRTLKGRAR
jgi:hypothetical protein